MLEVESKFEESDPTKVVKEGIYVRVSTDKQIHLRQIELMNNYFGVRKLNHQTEAQYEEKASARGKKTRAKFESMMSDLKSGRIHRIVASSMDRFVRSSQEFHKAVAHIKSCNGELHLIKENLTINNGSGPYQQLMATIFAAFAQFESDLISERTKEGMGATMKENPFTRYGQMPKIKGRQSAQLIKMYYAKERRARPRDQRRFGPKFKYTLQEISDKFGITKGALSQWVDARVQVGIMKLRQPSKAYELAKDDVEGLVEPERREPFKAHLEAGKERMKSRVLAPVLWPESIRFKVIKKYGNGYSNKGNKNAIKAYKYGTKLYTQWLEKQISTAQVGGDFDDLDALDIINEYSSVIDAPSVQTLSDQE